MPCPRLPCPALSGGRGQSLTTRRDAGSSAPPERQTPVRLSSDQINKKCYQGVHTDTLWFFEKQTQHKSKPGPTGFMEVGERTPCVKCLVGHGAFLAKRCPSFPGKGQGCGQRLHAVPAMLGVHSGQAREQPASPLGSPHTSRRSSKPGSAHSHTGAHATGGPRSSSMH